jgi:predicted DsbA family dithiol-disulfide isomerase
LSLNNLVKLWILTVNDELIEAVYAAYIEHRQDIGDPEVLVGIGEKFGMDAGQLQDRLGAEEARARVEAGVQEREKGEKK